MTAFCSGNDVRRLALAAITVLAIATTAAYVQAEDAPENAVTVNTSFPGGNAKVTGQTGSSVHVEPDLRGGRPWFYWYFETTSTKPGKVNFVFPEKVAGFKNGAIGFQGPAISTDLGKTWKWMGTDHVDGSSFSYEFAEANEPVRFAVTIPYVQTELDDFLKKHSSNPHLKKSVLTKSRNGREVELLQIGASGPNVKAMLVTGRHHAAETIASYVLEGFLQEAMSESELAKEFRTKYVLYAVPFVDKDGVEEGDQGKNRQPHDHNRDYGDESIYPEIQAIKKLDNDKNFRFALDFHCPTLVMNDHQVMYFVGPKEHPQYNFENVSEFASWIKKGLPKTAPVGPYVWLRPAQTPTPMNSHYFGFKEGAIMAATLEIPFAPPGKSTDPASCRKYGQAILAAWVATHFRSPDEKPTAKGERHAAAEEKTNAVAKVPDKFEWLPVEATGDAGRTELSGEQILPKITITKTPKPTADGANSRFTGARNRPELLANIAHTIYKKHLEQGAFSEVGRKIDSTDKIRSIEPFDLTKCKGEFEFGYSTGYLGYPFVRGRVYQTYFYDAQMKFIEMKKCLQFRKTTIPENARFAHLEFNQPEVSDEPLHAGAGRGSFVGRISNFKGPVDVHFHHNTLTGNRRLGLGYCGGRRWLIEDNLFAGNGGTAPGYGIDLEDGWEFMQDVVISNNRFKDNVKGDLVICAGSELLIEGNTFEHDVVVQARPHNYTFRNNKFSGGHVGYKTRTGVARIHDNTYENCSLSIVFDTKAVADGINRKPGEAVGEDFVDRGARDVGSSR